MGNHLAFEVIRLVGAQDVVVPVAGKGFVGPVCVGLGEAPLRIGERHPRHLVVRCSLFPVSPEACGGETQGGVQRITIHQPRCLHLAAGGIQVCCAAIGDLPGCFAQAAGGGLVDDIICRAVDPISTWSTDDFNRE